MALTICTNNPYCISWYGQELWARIRIAAWNDCSNCSNCFSVWKAIRRSPLSTLLKSWSVLKKMPSTTERNTTDARCIRARLVAFLFFGTKFGGSAKFFNRSRHQDQWHGAPLKQIHSKTNEILSRILTSPNQTVSSSELASLRCDGINVELISMRSPLIGWFMQQMTANWSLGERMVGLMETRGLACRDLYPIERVQIDSFQFSKWIQVSNRRYIASKPLGSWNRCSLQMSPADLSSIKWQDDGEMAHKIRGLWFAGWPR